MAYLFPVAVAYPTKILFWKRITAPPVSIRIRVRLLLILQRYYFESESQRRWGSYKGTIAVAYPTKILFWKRITALPREYQNYYQLLLILQRYYFESESQHPGTGVRNNPGCCLSYKDTILKANHSSIWWWDNRLEAVAYPTKILFWKRITATMGGSNQGNGLLLILQRYYFESESQLILHES